MDGAPAAAATAGAAAAAARPPSRPDLATLSWQGGVTGWSGEWAWRRIRWRQVWLRQDYANIIATVLVAISTGIVYWVATPENSLYYVWDARISYPYKGAPTVPEWVPFVVPAAALALTLVVGELFHSRALHRSLTDAVATIVYFALDALQSVIVTLFVTVITKFEVGQPRPDFLARCEPANFPSTNGSLTIAYGQDLRSAYPCTNPDAGVVDDGYQSFPSGHASAAFNLASYAAVYMMWCFHARLPPPRAVHAWGFRRRLASDARNVLAKYWMLVQMSFAWGVSLSRVGDYQHSIPDIIGGALVGILFALIYGLRAIPRHRRVVAPWGEEGSEAEPLDARGAPPHGVSPRASAAARKPGGGGGGGPRVDAAAEELGGGAGV